MPQINEQTADYQLADLSPALKASDTGSIMLEGLPIWLSAQTRKSAGRGRSADNTLQYGVQKLRELILELAVRGKLVPQDPNDEPASVLLEKIAEEKKRLVKDGEIRKSKPLPSIKAEEAIDWLPATWSVCRLNDIGTWGSGATPKRGVSEYYGGGIPWFKSGELAKDFINSSEETITEKALKESSVKLNSPGSVLIAMYGATIGKASILEVEATTNQAICACYPFKGVSNLFLLLLLKAYKSRFIGMGAGGAQPNISRDKIIATVIGLPPLAEQHRIVKKVDELMTLCDQLEQQQADAVQAHDTLVKVLLDTLTQSENADDFQQNWRRIAEHFDTLFTTESSIDQLKQTLLQLAVMGKLVPQDPNDEPASVLLEKIAEEKARLLREGKIKKQKPLPTISDEEKLHHAPASWVWTRLGNICQINPRNEADEETLVSFVPMPLVSTSHNGAHDQETRKWKEIKSGYTHFADGDVAIAKITPCFENGKAAFFQNLKNGLGAGTTELHVARPYGYTLYPRYILTYLKAPQFLVVGESKMTGTAGQKRVPKEFFAENPLPLPPLAEQHRIVQKVDELMALCDKLKVRLIQAQTLQQKLADTVINEALR